MLLHILPNTILTIALLVRCFDYPQFIDEKKEAQRLINFPKGPPFVNGRATPWPPNAVLGQCPVSPQGLICLLCYVCVLLRACGRPRNTAVLHTAHPGLTFHS